MAYVLIGGTAVGTVLTLAFLPALYAIWFRESYVDAVRCNHGKFAAEQKISEEEALRVGLEQKTTEFTKSGAEIYAKT